MNINYMKEKSIFEKEKIVIKEYENEYIEKIAGFNNLINLGYKN